MNILKYYVFGDTFFINSHVSLHRYIFPVLFLVSFKIS